MRGNIEKRGEGVYRIRIYTGRDESGKRLDYRETFHGTEKEAEKRKTALLAQLDNQTLPSAANMTVGQYLDLWLESYAKHNVRPRTYESYELHVRLHLKPALGRIKLAKLTGLHIDQYYGQALESGRKDMKNKGKPLSVNTVRRHHSTLHEALRHAVEWGYIARNPADAAHPPEPKKKRIVTWTPEELQRFLDVAAQTRWFPLFFTMGYTGMRLGEILGLKWKYVDLREQIIQVRETLVKAGTNPVFGEPKSEKSKRDIPIPDPVVAMLRKHKAKQAEEKLLLGPEYRDFDLVFATTMGTPIDKGNLYEDAWCPLVEAAGVPRIPRHNMRHGFATMALDSGVDPKTLSELLGHYSVAFTMDTYVHPKLDAKRKAMAMFSRYVASND